MGSMLQKLDVGTLINICNTQKQHTLQLIKADIFKEEYNTPVWIDATTMMIYSEEFIETWADKIIILNRNQSLV